MGMIRTQSLRITPVILTAIAEIDEFKGAWRALGSLAPERLSASSTSAADQGGISPPSARSGTM